MSDVVLTVNAGSSSLKFSIFITDKGALAPLFAGIIELQGGALVLSVRDASGKSVENSSESGGSTFNHSRALNKLFEWLAKSAQGHRLIATGHRIVHGGARFTQPVRVDATVLAELEKLIPLAPLHQPQNVTALRAAMEYAPHLPHVACFDTSFHRTQPRLAEMYALPKKYTNAGVIAYGFHGLSYEYIASVLPSVDAQAAHGRTIVAHLGNGASLCALKNGLGIATTMGFTPLDGLVMGTRCGTTDPGVLLHLMRSEKIGLRELEHLLYFESGLLGVSGVSNDVRKLLASTDASAAEAIDLFVYRAIKEIGALIAVLGGLDALVFTAGIGEHSAQIRSRICKGFEWLGLAFDEQANIAKTPRISLEISRVRAWIIPTNEELVIARHTSALASK